MIRKIVLVTIDGVNNVKYKFNHCVDLKVNIQQLRDFNVLVSAIVSSEYCAIRPPLFTLFNLQ